MVSVEGLAKLVDPSQLTDDFEGSLDYNHEEWMDLRVSLEEFMSNAVHLLSRLEDLQVGAAKAQRMGVTAVANMTSVFCLLQELLSKKDFPADVEGSRRLIEEHTQLKKKVSHYQYRCRHSQRLTLDRAVLKPAQFSVLLLLMRGLNCAKPLKLLSCRC